MDASTVRKWVNAAEREELKELVDHEKENSDIGLYPGDSRLKGLITKHKGNYAGIAAELSVAPSTVRHWVNAVGREDLRELADELSGRSTQVDYPGDERMKEVIEAHSGNLTAIGEELGVASLRTISKWLRDSSGSHLKSLAEQLRNESLSAYPGDEKMRALIKEYAGNYTAIAEELSVADSTVGQWVRVEGREGLKQLADDLSGRTKRAAVIDAAQADDSSANVEELDESEISVPVAFTKLFNNQRSRLGINDQNIHFIKGDTFEQLAGLYLDVVAGQSIVQGRLNVDFEGRRRHIRADNYYSEMLKLNEIKWRNASESFKQQIVKYLIAMDNGENLDFTPEEDHMNIVDEKTSLEIVVAEKAPEIEEFIDGLNDSRVSYLSLEEHISEKSELTSEQGQIFISIQESIRTLIDSEISLKVMRNILKDWELFLFNLRIWEWDSDEKIDILEEANSYIQDQRFIPKEFWDSYVIGKAKVPKNGYYYHDEKGELEYRSYQDVLNQGTQKRLLAFYNEENPDKPKVNYDTEVSDWVFDNEELIEDHFRGIRLKTLRQERDAIQKNLEKLEEEWRVEMSDESEISDIWEYSNAEGSIIEADANRLDELREADFKRVSRINERFMFFQDKLERVEKDMEAISDSDGSHIRGESVIFAAKKEEGLSSSKREDLIGSLLHASEKRAMPQNFTADVFAEFNTPTTVFFDVSEMRQNYDSDQIAEVHILAYAYRDRDVKFVGYGQIASEDEILSEMRALKQFIYVPGSIENAYQKYGQSESRALIQMTKNITDRIRVFKNRLPKGKMRFFKYDSAGVLAIALLDAESGPIAGLGDEDGFLTATSAYLNKLAQDFLSRFVFAQSA